MPKHKDDLLATAQYLFDMMDGSGVTNAVYVIPDSKSLTSGVLDVIKAFEKALGKVVNTFVPCATHGSIVYIGRGHSFIRVLQERELNTYSHSIFLRRVIIHKKVKYHPKIDLMRRATVKNDEKEALGLPIWINL